MPVLLFYSKKVSSNYVTMEEDLVLDSVHFSVIHTVTEDIIKIEFSPTLVNMSKKVS